MAGNGGICKMGKGPKGKRKWEGGGEKKKNREVVFIIAFECR